MKFTETRLSGSYVIEFDKLVDERGFFARSYDSEKFKNLNLNQKIVHCNVSFSYKKGTIRGMHYQISPYEESKLIRCTKGKVLDVIIDLRENSNSKFESFSVELDSSKHNMLYVPEGFAHGFQTLEDNSEVFYQNSEIHMPEFERGVRFDDPFFNIEWPINEKIVSEKDRSWPLVSNDEIKE